MEEDLLSLEGKPVGTPEWNAIVLFRINKKIFETMSNEKFQDWYKEAKESEEIGLGGLKTIALKDKNATMSYIAELYQKIYSS